MTRRRLRQNLALFFAVCAAILVVAAAARLAGGPRFAALYDFIRDMSLIFVTAAAAYMAHVFQRRLTFLQSLREEWRDIVDTKTALVAFCDREMPALDDYLDAYARISRTIDYMRIVYANVGETDKLVGLYPYQPLHDMRKGIERLDPRSATPFGAPDRAAARDTIWEAFNALRESFLDELDLEEPASPIFKPGSTRTKKPGADLAPARPAPSKTPVPVMTELPPEL